MPLRGDKKTCNPVKLYQFLSFFIVPQKATFLMVGC